MKKSHLWIIVFLMVTLIPAIVIMYTKSKNNFKNSASPRPMWPLGLKENGKDSIYFEIPDFLALNANGATVSTQEMLGKVTIVETFFTSCQSICPIMNHNLERVFKELKHNKNLQIYSYTVDASRDSLPVLKAYAQNEEIAKKTESRITKKQYNLNFE